MKKRYWMVAACAGLVATAWFMTRPDKVANAVLISGGPILTMDPGMPQVEALIVQDGIITDRGNLARLLDITPELGHVDLNGQTLIPGLIDPHTHPLATALLGAVVDVSGFRHSTRAEVMDTLRTSADKIALTPWLVAYGWDPVALPDLSPPTLAELDAIAPDRPMLVLTQMLHEAFANSAALRAANIPIEGPANVRHGVVRDEQGHPTGALRELEAINQVMSALPPPPEAVVELLLRRQYAAYAKAGYTGIGIAGAVGRHPDPVALFKRITQDDIPPLHSTLYLLDDQIADHPLGGTEDFAIAGAKIWMDGSPFTGGAATDAPYENSALAQDRLGLSMGHMGHVRHKGAEFSDRITDLHRKGYQLAFHTQGEQAVRGALDAIEMAQSVQPMPGLHHRLEHNALITQTQIQRAKELGVSLGFFIDHLYFYGDALPQLFGPDRMGRYLPTRWAQDQGLTLTLHGDHPATPLGPMRSLATAINRRSKSGETQTGADQALTVSEALAAMTRNAAAQLGRAEKVGSLHIGKQADFTLLSANPLTVPTAELASITVVGTWRNGQPVNTSLGTWAKPSLVLKALKQMVLK